MGKDAPNPAETCCARVGRYPGGINSKEKRIGDCGKDSVKGRKGWGSVCEKNILSEGVMHKQTLLTVYHEGWLA